MNKIYFIRANKTKFGGAEVYLSRLSEELKKQSIEHKIINSNIPKFLPSWLRIILFNIQVCFSKKDKLYFSLDRITCPDIYRAGDGVHKVFLSIEKKSKINFLHKVYLNFEKKAFTNAKKIIAISNMVKEDIINSYDINPSKIEVIYNGINIQKPNYNTAYTKLSSEFKISKKDKIILYVGSGFKRKGVKEFLQIISKLKFDNFKAFIIGKEKKINYYKQLASKLDIEHKVFFTGPRTDVNDFYTISDIFLFPTKYEPFGSVILEAMNFGNAVFTTEYCGGGEILEKKYIMSNSKDFSVIEKIDALLLDEDRLMQVKESNIQKVQNFSIEENVANTLRIINEVLEK